MMAGSGDGGFFLRVRGLPWTASKTDVIKFFDDSEILNGEQGIHMTLARGGRPSGECYIEFASDQCKENAFKKHKQTMGHRYIEIFPSERSEMEWVTRKNSMANEGTNSGFVWLRGIPFGCSKEEIAQFFTGLKIVPNGITLPLDEMGRSTGEGYVQFASKELAEEAMGKHKEKIGHRYIEIFPSSQQEVRNCMSKSTRSRPGGAGGRPGPYSRGGDRYGDSGGRYGGGNRRGMKSFYDDEGYDDYNDDYGSGFGGGKFGGRQGGRPGMGGPSRGMGRNGRRDMGRNNSSMNIQSHNVHMRGLPFRATEQDVADFFKPIPIIDIEILYGNDGRAAGKANVSFPTHKDAVRAMDRDKQHMQHRYVELFLESEAGNDDYDDMGGNMGGGNNDQGMGMDSYNSGPPAPANRGGSRMGVGGGRPGGTPVNVPSNNSGGYGGYQSNRMQDTYNDDDQYADNSDPYNPTYTNNGYQNNSASVYQTNSNSGAGMYGGNSGPSMGGAGGGGMSGNRMGRGGGARGGGGMMGAQASVGGAGGYNQGYTEF